VILLRRIKTLKSSTRVRSAPETSLALSSCATISLRDATLLRVHQGNTADQVLRAVIRAPDSSALRRVVHDREENLRAADGRS